MTFHEPGKSFYHIFIPINIRIQYNMIVSTFLYRLPNSNVMPTAISQVIAINIDYSLRHGFQFTQAIIRRMVYDVQNINIGLKNAVHQTM